ncbi:MAG: hypothetical protein ACYC09_06580 [Bacteroidota bacterium]
MKLYIFSSTASTLTRTHRLRLQYALIGAVIGTIVFFGFFTFDYFVAPAQGTRTTYDLRIENDLLHRHLDQAASRAAAIEMQIRHLHKQNLVLRAVVVQSDIAEQRLFTLILPDPTPDSLALSTVAMSGGR